MDEPATCTAFLGDSRLAGGAPWEVALAVKAVGAERPGAMVLVFDDRTGAQLDFDLRGDDDAIAARLRPAAPAEPATRPVGRPKLGVVAREVTLLPRQWDWLAGQPGGASASLRRLVDEARRAGEGRARIRAAQAAADRFMLAMLGDRPGYEEASRALYAGDEPKFVMLTAAWPADLRDHLRRLAAPAFGSSVSAAATSG